MFLRANRLFSRGFGYVAERHSPWILIGVVIADGLFEKKNPLLLRPTTRRRQSTCPLQLRQRKGLLEEFSHPGQQLRQLRRRGCEFPIPDHKMTQYAPANENPRLVLKAAMVPMMRISA
jgi:hypothetical protein